MFANFDGNRKELLIRIANSANAEQLGVDCIIKNLDKNTQKKYNVSKDEFIRVYSEDIFASMFVGYCNDYPKVIYDEEELKRIESRGNYIRKVWKDACDLMKREGDGCELEKKIATHQIKSWEELENFIFSYYSIK